MILAQFLTVAWKLAKDKARELVDCVNQKKPGPRS